MFEEERKTLHIEPKIYLRYVFNFFETYWNSVVQNPDALIDVYRLIRASYELPNEDTFASLINNPMIDPVKASHLYKLFCKLFELSHKFNFSLTESEVVCDEKYNENIFEDFRWFVINELSYAIGNNDIPEEEDIYPHILCINIETITRLVQKKANSSCINLENLFSLYKAFEYNYWNQHHGIEIN